MKILIPRAFSHFREHKPSCEIRLICSCCRCAHFGSVSFPPPNRQSLKSVQSLNCVETLNSHEGNDILYHLQGQLASGFKPRSHEGNDPAREKGGAMNDMFQSTFPRGERPSLHLIRRVLRCFNPRSHEGNDPFFGGSGPPTRCFNPRSHEGNDAGTVGFLFMVSGVSIHVPTRGTTRFSRKRILQLLCFNPRSREGNDEV